LICYQLFEMLIHPITSIVEFQNPGKDEKDCSRKERTGCEQNYLLYCA